MYTPEYNLMPDSVQQAKDYVRQHGGSFEILIDGPQSIVYDEAENRMHRAEGSHGSDNAITSVITGQQHHGRPATGNSG